jgi:hypothetical protein
MLTNAAIDHAAELRFQQAQAMLDLFEADRQRAAVTLEELREWANAQNQGHLQFRVNQYRKRNAGSVLRERNRLRDFVRCWLSPSFRPSPALIWWPDSFKRVDSTESGHIRPPPGAHQWD